MKSLGARAILRLVAPFLFLTSATLFIATSCGPTAPRATLRVVSGSENESLEPLIEEFEEESGIAVEIDYRGSVDMMLEMSAPDFPYDAVWPANGLWISLGDEQRRVKHIRSIMTSPVVFGIQESVAERLGWNNGEVFVADILEAIQEDRFSFMMTSATQSNSGSTAYLGFLYALAGNPDVLSMEDLEDAELRSGVRSLLAGIHRSSGSSGWLKELFLESDYEAMVNYEALIIEANQELVRQGREPLYAVYPVDGIVMADSPLGYVDKGDDEKEEAFLALQEYLLSDEVQNQIGGLGRRTGFGGVAGDVDTDVFNPDWGLQPNRVISSITLPSAEVIREALFLYQTEFRKPSLTIFALDHSSSMLQGNGIDQLREAMAMLLDQEEASRYMIQTGREDRIGVLPFSYDVIGGWETVGNDQDDLSELMEQINSQVPDGGTNIYAPIMVAVSSLADFEDLDKYIPAIILMTDGAHTAETTFADMRRIYARAGLDIPVFGILFGNAVESELEQIAEFTRARVFDGRENLIDAFRRVKGYN